MNEGLFEKLFANAGRFCQRQNGRHTIPKNLTD